MYVVKDRDEGRAEQEPVVGGNGDNRHWMAIKKKSRDENLMLFRNSADSATQLIIPS